jgi:pyrroline-5-carboxylate reductase
MNKQIATNYKIAIIGGGNIGTAIARGLIHAGSYMPSDIIITRRKINLLENMRADGFRITDDNCEAVSLSDNIIISVEPQQLTGVLKQIKDKLDTNRHIILSVVSGASIEDMKTILGNGFPVVRVMPNIAVAISESMTCISVSPDDERGLKAAREIFDTVGKTMVIDEELMVPATALCACGIAFFFRAIRAASQGGIEIGFHSDEALAMAAQTAKGAAALLNQRQHHPETEIDRVTTPRGCTIAGLNNMEHKGFSSAMIKGIITSAEKAERLFQVNNSK